MTWIGHHRLWWAILKNSCPAYIYGRQQVIGIDNAPGSRAPVCPSSGPGASSLKSTDRLLYDLRTGQRLNIPGRDLIVDHNFLTPSANSFLNTAAVRAPRNRRANP